MKGDATVGNPNPHYKWFRQYAWEGPSFLARLAGQMPREAPLENEVKMKKALGLFGLTMMSTAAIIGAGIFVLTGIVARNTAGPGVIISYLLAGIVAAISAYCYMEFAAETHTCGASIVYSCKVFGKFVAWLVAINVLMELIIAGAAVSKGFSSYFSSLIVQIDSMVAHPSVHLAAGTKPSDLFRVIRHGAHGEALVLDFMAFAVVILVTLLLAWGVKESSWVESLCTSLCVLSIVMSIIAGFTKTNPANWGSGQTCAKSPEGVASGLCFAPYGFSGIFAGASTVFFAYLGFEMMATAPEEAHNAKRDVPLGIGISVAGCTLLYILMCMVITGMVPWYEIDKGAPFAVAFSQKGYNWMSIIVSVGAMLGILDTVIVVLYSMSRVFVILGRMGLMPMFLSRVHPYTQTPIWSTLFCGALSAVLALLVSLDTLADLTSMGALFAFCVVCAAVLFRRYYQPPSAVLPDSPRGAPIGHVLVPFLLIIGSSLGLAFAVMGLTRTHFGVWIAMVVVWFLATLYMQLRLPIVFRPEALPTPLFPWWPSFGILSTIFLIASLGPDSWEQWAIGVAAGLFIYILYVLCDTFGWHRELPPPSEAPSTSNGKMALAGDAPADVVTKADDVAVVRDA